MKYFFPLKKGAPYDKELSNGSEKEKKSANEANFNPGKGFCIYQKYKSKKTKFTSSFYDEESAKRQNFL
jgi:hypothetical protein